jgi:hypothetical protein
MIITSSCKVFNRIVCPISQLLRISDLSSSVCCFLFTADTAQTWSYGPHSTSSEGGEDFTDALR